jgi:hypothetical protein
VDFAENCKAAKKKIENPLFCRRGSGFCRKFMAAKIAENCKAAQPVVHNQNRLLPL